MLSNWDFKLIHPYSIAEMINSLNYILQILYKIYSTKQKTNQLIYCNISCNGTFTRAKGAVTTNIICPEYIQLRLIMFIVTSHTEVALEYISCKQWLMWFEFCVGVHNMHNNVIETISAAYILNLSI